MVCYARPAARMALLLLVIFVVFGRAAGHAVDSAALTVTVAVAVAAALTTALSAALVFRSTRRRRALAGGCMSCRFQCQHAMTERAPQVPVARQLQVVSVTNGGRGLGDPGVPGPQGWSP